MEPALGYRYPGARPFQDTDLDRKLFCGRNTEADRLLHMLLSERLVVLYGRSGVGKSSLVNAGVLQSLRQSGLAPIKIRLNNQANGCLPAIFTAVAEAAALQGWECHPGDTTSLWRYFKTLELWHGDTLLVPFLVFDQFEELFTLQTPPERERFITEFAGLVRGADLPGVDSPNDGRLPEAKILLSLREDFLPELEQLSRFVPQILANRFRLGQLSTAQATEAIRKPATQQDPQIATAPFSFSEDAVGRLVGFLSGQEQRTGSDDHVVEPFQLQVVCQKAEQIVRDRERAGALGVCLEYADFGGDAGVRATLGDFYEAQVRSLSTPGSAQRVFRLCARGLINPDGRRLSLEESDIRRRFSVSPKVLGELVDRRVLRADPRMGSTYYELSHDSLVTPVTEGWQRRRRRRLRWAGVAAGLVVAAGVIAFIVAERAADARLALSAEATQFLAEAHDDPTLATAKAIDLAARFLKMNGAIPASVNRGLAAAAGTGEVLETAPLPIGTTTAAISPRGEFVVAGDDKGAVHLLDVQGGSIATWTSADRAPVFAVAIAETTGRVATLHGTADASGRAHNASLLRLWSLRSIDGKQPERTVSLNGFAAVKLAFAPDEQSIAVLGEDGRVGLVDAVTGDWTPPAAPAGAPVLHDQKAVLAFQYGGRWLAASETPERLRLWHLPNARQAEKADQTIEPILAASRWAFSAYGPAMAAAMGPLVFVQANVTAPGEARLIRPLAAPTAPDASRPSTASMLNAADVTAVTVDPQGRAIATGHRDGRVRLIDLSKDEAATTFSASKSMIAAIAVDSDGNLTTVADGESPVVWNRSGNQLYTLNTSNTAAPARAARQPDVLDVFSTDRRSPDTSALRSYEASCKVIFAGTEDGQVRLFRLPQPSPSTTSTGAAATEGTQAKPTREPSAKAARNSQALDASVTLDRKDSRRGDTVLRDENVPMDIAISAQGDRIAIGDLYGRVELWSWNAAAFCGDAKTPPSDVTPVELGHVQLEGDATVFGLRFSSDGSRLLATTEDGLATWTVAQFPKAGTARVTEARVRAAVFDPANNVIGLTNDGQITGPNAGRRFAPLRVTAATFTGTADELLVGDQFGNWTTARISLTSGGENWSPLIRQDADGHDVALASFARPPASASTLPSGDADAGLGLSLSDPVSRYGRGSAAVQVSDVSGLGPRGLFASENGFVEIQGGDQTTARVQAPIGDEVLIGAQFQQEDAHVTLLTSQHVLAWHVPASKKPGLDGVDPSTLMPAHTIAPDIGARKLVDPFGRYFAAFTSDGALAMYDAASGLNLSWLRSIKINFDPDFCGKVTSAAMTPSGGLLAGCEDGSIATLESNGAVLTGARYAAPKDDKCGLDDAGKRDIRVVATSKSGRIVAAGTGAGDVLLWIGGQFSCVPKAHGGRVVALDISPDETRLVSAGNDGETGREVKVWPLKADPSQKPRADRILSGHTMGEVNYVEFSPDGRMFLSAGDDGTVRVWNAVDQSEEPLRVLTHADDRNREKKFPVQTATFSGSQIVSQIDGPLFYLWDETGQQLTAPDSKMPDAGAQAWMDAACHNLGSQQGRADEPAARDAEAASRHAALSRTMDICRTRIAAAKSTPAAHAAAIRGDVEYLKSAVRSKSAAGALDSQGRPLLYAAAEAGQPAAVRYLIAAGADLNGRDKAGRTALSIAVQSGHELVAQMLLDAGASADVAAESGDTPLHFAATRGDLAMVKLLLDHKANASTADAFGATPLMNAADGGDDDIAAALITAGADVNARDCNGSTALMEAVRASSSRLVERLLEAHADVDVQTTPARARDRTTALLIALNAVSRNDRIIDDLRAKKPQVTSPLPAITVRYPIARYLPGDLHSMLPDLQAWNDVGIAGMDAGRVFESLKAKQDHPFVQFLIGRAYEVGIGVAPDSRAAVEWYRRSAAGGNAIGTLALALAEWAAPSGVQQDVDDARRLLSQLAAPPESHPLASVYYAQMLIQSGGDEQAKQGRDLLKKAADTGEPVAQNSYGVQIDDDPQTVHEATDWFQKAAAQQDPFGVYNVGIAYFEARGLPAAFDKALQSLEQSAGLHPPAPSAASTVGDLYQYGLGVPASVGEALKWYRMSAREDESTQDKIGWMLEAQDQHRVMPSVEALRGYYRAAGAGSYFAKQRLRALKLKP